MAAPIYRYSHPVLGDLKGRLSTQPIISSTAEVVQFRSIPFATVSARFRLAQGPLDSIPEKYDNRPSRDFTQYGYACPQIEQPRDAGGGDHGQDDVRKYDEFACLNCTVTVPRKALEGRLKDLPVMVYIHGGAITEGAGHISASHDTSRMVALSLKEGTPVIMVNLGYRLNWFGFFTCSDLLNEYRNAGDGFVANLGFRDQRLGLQWVQRQIAGFGGNPANVTAFGESAGSISLTHQLCANEPLFQRVILQSGIATAPEVGLKQRDEVYERLLKYLDIDQQTGEAKLEALRLAPVERLVQAVADLKASPLWPYLSADDPFYANGSAEWSTVEQQIKNCDWCKEIILGDSSFEGFMWVKDLLQMQNRDSIPKCLSAAFQQPDVQALQNYYGMDPSLPHNLFWTNTARFFGDFAFSEPVDKVARGLASSTDHKVYRCQVCLSNPFSGSMYSYVSGHHFVELMYLFLTYLERFPTHRNNFFAKVARDIARKWIGFANGTAPWAEYREGNGYSIGIFDDLRGIDVRTREEDENVSKEDVWGERRYKGLEILRNAIENAEDSEQARGVIMNVLI